MKVDFEFYTDCYLGSLIHDAEEFNALELKAEYLIDRITFGNIDEYGEEVKMAVCAVCDKLKNDRSGILSENNDGYSVTYNDGDFYTEVIKAALIYLPEELTYRGI